MNLVTAQGKPVTLGSPIGQGGEATVYKVTGQPGSLAKIYEPEPRANYLQKLTWMVAHPPENPTAELQHASLAWPESLLLDAKGNLKGYCMPYIDQAVPLLDVFNPRRRAVILPQFDRRYLHRTARNLAAALSALHRSGYVAGDVNESNILVTPTAMVTLIDADSFQVRENRSGKDILHHCPVGKPEYTPPELQGKPLGEVTRLPDHDAFGLAVLIFQLLMNGSHPFRAQWLGQGDPPPIEKRIHDGAFPYVASHSYPIQPPADLPDLDALHPNISELLMRCFVDGHRSPRWRPSPDLWARAIAQAEASLVCCAEGHFFSSHLSACPYCALNQKRLGPASAAVPRVIENRRNRPGRRVPLAAVPPAGSQPGLGARPGAVKSSRPGAVQAQNFPISRNIPLSSWLGPAAVVPSPAGAPLGVGSPGFQPTGVLHVRPAVNPVAIGAWLRQWITNSLVVGGGQGALAGMVPGAAVGFLSWLSVSALHWEVILALSGAAGGLLRGWQPGYRLAGLINQYIGWKRFWQGLGLTLGAVGGSLLGLFTNWPVIPVVLGLVLGAWFGVVAGSKIYQMGINLRWERIWGVFTALLAAGLGWGAASLVGAVGLNTFGARLVVGLQPFSADDTLSAALLWLIAGGTSGAIFGAVSGILVDLIGRFTRLTR